MILPRGSVLTPRSCSANNTRHGSPRPPSNGGVNVPKNAWWNSSSDLPRARQTEVLSHACGEGFQWNWSRPIPLFNGQANRPATEWRQEYSPRREPWDGNQVGGKPRQGRQNGAIRQELSFAATRLRSFELRYPRLTPWAMF